MNNFVRLTHNDNKEIDCVEYSGTIYRRGDEFYYYDRLLWHIVSFYTDCKTPFVVIKYWNRNKYSWIHKCVSLYDLSWWVEGIFHNQTKKLRGKKYIKARNNF